MEEFFHSVTLNKDKCKGCINCIKRCPTEAIRVRNGKAQIIKERCIDCSECIRVCPHHAKRAKFDGMELMEQFTYNIALPAPTLYGQFNNLDDIDFVLTGLRELGFDQVFEVSRGAELVSDATRKLMAENKLKLPVVSSACPAVVRLIRVRFPDLCDHVLPLLSPMEYAARLAREEAREQTGLKDKDIGVFFISPCAAKVTDVKAPISCAQSAVSGVLAISDIYPVLVEKMNKVERPQSLCHSGIIGVSWASSGGESAALLKEKYLAADGIENVIEVLEDLEDERLNELDFIELNACNGGCVGGVLTVENPYVAKARIQRLRKYLPVASNHLDGDDIPGDISWTRELEFRPVMKLSEDMGEAMRLLNEIDQLTQLFPGLDCGSCGSPSCRALAEDIVKGNASQNDCIFVLREQVKNVASALSSIGGYVPPMERKKETE